MIKFFHSSVTIHFLSIRLRRLSISWRSMMMCCHKVVNVVKQQIGRARAAIAVTTAAAAAVAVGTTLTSFFVEATSQVSQLINASPHTNLLVNLHVEL